MYTLLHLLRSTLNASTARASGSGPEEMKGLRQTSRFGAWYFLDQISENLGDQLLKLLDCLYASVFIFPGMYVMVRSTSLSWHQIKIISVLQTCNREPPMSLCAKQHR